jgi:hypothetical protein
MAFLPEGTVANHVEHSAPWNSQMEVQFNLMKVQFDLTEVQFNLREVQFSLTGRQFHLVGVQFNLRGVQFDLTGPQFNRRQVQFDLTAVQLNLLTVQGRRQNAGSLVTAGAAPRRELLFLRSPEPPFAIRRPPRQRNPRHSRGLPAARFPGNRSGPRAKPQTSSCRIAHAG